MITRRSLLWAAPVLALDLGPLVRRAFGTQAPSGDLLVYNAVAGTLSLVRDAGSERAKSTELPGVKLGRWNVRIGVLDDHLLTLDTESRRIHAIDLGWVRSWREGRAGTTPVRTTPLRAGLVPYRAVHRGDRVWVDYFSANRIEAYRWQRSTASFEFAGEHVVPNPRPLGLSDLLIHGDRLWVAASGISCLARICPKESKPDPRVFAFRIDREPLGELTAELRPSNVNAAGLYLHPGTGTTYVLNAGDFRAGYSSLQRLDAKGRLAPEIRLARNAGAARAFPLDARTFLVLQFSGEHAFVVDAHDDRVLAALRFDGRAFVPARVDRPLDERFKSDLQDVLPDPLESGRLFIVDSKREQLLHVAFRPPSALELLSATPLGTAAFKSAPSWAMWLAPAI